MGASWGVRYRYSLIYSRKKPPSSFQVEKGPSEVRQPAQVTPGEGCEQDSNIQARDAAPSCWSQAPPTLPVLTRGEEQPPGWVH